MLDNDDGSGSTGDFINVGLSFSKNIPAAEDEEDEETECEEEGVARLADESFRTTKGSCGFDTPSVGVAFIVTTPLLTVCVGVRSLSTGGPSGAVVDDHDDGCRTGVGACCLALAAADGGAFVFGTGTGDGANSLSNGGPSAEGVVVEDVYGCRTGAVDDVDDPCCLALMLNEELAAAVTGRGGLDDDAGAFDFGTRTSSFSPRSSSPPAGGGVANLSNGEALIAGPSAFAFAAMKPEKPLLSVS
ncbi:hypothetical protein AAF712_013622 [Marasmius tenuissimus]|uniref:Uncharacterized protein n=1 Tax=Marasmius tenuissimus TaxID=585030 RepID=A0ABR2ZD64_9AGAR